MHVYLGRLKLLDFSQGLTIIDLYFTLTVINILDVVEFVLV
jgi:hypothetical protein